MWQRKDNTYNFFSTWQRMKKETSQNQENKIRIQNSCPTAFALGLISGRWKPIIFWRLRGKTLRYGKLKRSIPGISERMLINQLREMEADGLIERLVSSEIPPRVEYRLAPLGESLMKALWPLSLWGASHHTDATYVAESRETAHEANTVSS